MRRTFVPGSALLVLALLTWSPPATAQEAAPVGTVKNVAGEVTLRRGDRALPATVGARLYEGDLIETGEFGSAGIVFRDNAALSLGPRSWVVVDRFLFAPAEGRFAFVARVLRGTAAYLSGLIARLAPGTAVFETPVATIGVRGTHFAVRVTE